MVDIVLTYSIYVGFHPCSLERNVTFLVLMVGGGGGAYQAKHNLTQSLQPKRFTNSFVNIFDETKEINGLEKEIKILFYIEKYKKYLIP